MDLPVIFCSLGILMTCFTISLMRKEREIVLTRLTMIEMLLVEKQTGVPCEIYGEHMKIAFNQGYEKGLREAKLNGAISNTK